MPWAFAALGLGAALVSIALWAPWRTTPVPTPRKLLVSIGVDATMGTILGAPAVLSPEGTTLAVVAQVTGGLSQLFVRKLDQLQAAPLAGTEGAASPFFSPDGQWIAFFAGGKLKKVLITGGAPVTLCDAEAGRGGTWTDDDSIIFTPSGLQPVKLLRVSASGGAPAVLGTLDEGAVTQRWPQALPGGKAVLYTEHSSTNVFDGANLVVAPLAGGTPKIVMRGAYYGRYVPSGSDSPTAALPRRSEAKAGTCSTCSRARSSRCPSISIASRRPARPCRRLTGSRPTRASAAPLWRSPPMARWCTCRGRRSRM